MKIRNRDYGNDPIQEEHLKVGLPQIESGTFQGEKHPFLFLFCWVAAFFMILIFIFLASKFFQTNGVHWFSKLVEVFNNPDFWTAVVIGFVAQVIDGALGMAYGISATAFLLSTGSSPAVASASVHIAAVFTTGLSGISHVNLGNVSKDLFLRLLLPGIAGALMGVLLVTQISTEVFKPLMGIYLLVMGFVIIIKAYKKQKAGRPKQNNIGKLALFGGFFDSAGGGGWGPIVTTNLLGKGQDPRSTIGTVNFAEFFLTLSTAGFFTIFITASPWVSVAGLVIGGLFAAPFAAFICRKIPPKTLMIIVGLVVCLVSSFSVVQIV